MARTAATLAEERACGRRYYGWGAGSRPVAVAGNGGSGAAVPAIALPRLAARAAALEVAAPHRTPRPGEGRAPTTAGSGGGRRCARRRGAEDAHWTR